MKYITSMIYLSIYREQMNHSKTIQIQVALIWINKIYKIRLFCIISIKWLIKGKIQQKTCKKW